MATRIDWLPYGMKGRLETMRQIAAQIDQYGPGLGLTAAQIARIKEIPEEYAFAIDIYQHNRQMTKSLRAWRDAVISNKRSVKPAGERPMYDNSPAPAGTKNGLVFELRKLVGMMKASAAFNPQIGTAMGVMSPQHVKTPLVELRPASKVQSVEGFRLKIWCEMQGMDALQVEYRRNGEEKWRTVAFLTSLPETIYIEPNVRGVPESGLIRCLFLKKNKIVGQPSNMLPVTIFGM